MERSLIELFDFLDDKDKSELDGIVVKKVSAEMQGDETRLDVFLSGIDVIKRENTLAFAEYKAKTVFDCDVRFIFDEFGENDAERALEVLAELIVNEIVFEEPDFYMLAMFSRYELADGRLKIITDDLNEECGNDVLTYFAKLFAELFKQHTGLVISGFDVSYERIETCNYKLASKKSEPEEDLPEPSDEPKDSKPDTKTKAKPKTKASKAEEKEASEEKPLDKNSWEFKSIEAKKVFKESGNNDKNFFRAKLDENAICGKVKKGIEFCDIKDITYDRQEINVVGRIKINMDDDMKLAKSGKCVITNFMIIDKTGGIAAMMFIQPKEADLFSKTFKKGGYAGFQGNVENNRGEMTLKVTGIFPADPPQARMDTASEKRVELHVHTKMSEKDAVIDTESLIKTAAKFGHRACAVTDHGVVQAFPAAYNTAKGLKVGDTEEKFKSILGVEGYLVDDGPTIVYNLPFVPEHKECIGSLVSIALKVRGEDSAADNIESIVLRKYQIKGFKPLRIPEEGESNEEARLFSEPDIDRSLWNKGEFKGYDDEDEYSDEEAIDEKVNPSVITYAEGKGPDYIDYSEEEEPYIPEIIEYEFIAEYKADFLDEHFEGSGKPCDSYFKAEEIVNFIGDSYVCGKEIFKALDYLRFAGYRINVEEHEYYRQKFLMPAVDVEKILELQGKTIKDVFDDGLSLSDEADLCFKLISEYVIEQGTSDPYELNYRIGHFTTEQIKERKNFAYHVILLARNNMGLYNMYRLISEGHVNYFKVRPRMPRSLIRYYHSSIIIGSACERGEVYRQVYKAYRETGKNYTETLNILKSDKLFRDTVKLYDYIEIQPLTNNSFMTREVKEDGIMFNMTDIMYINKMLVELADYFNLPCCATTDAHFLNPEDGMYRKNMLMEMGFEDAENQADLYFRTTDEMLEEFAPYLGDDKAFEVVVKNTNMIADKIEYGIKPFPDGTYPPIISTAASDVRDITWTRANRMYRHNGVLDPTVKARLEKELDSIIGHGFAIMYYIAYRLVKKSNNDGYIVGSRGSVGSSLVATMCGISEVNPLAPHYRCPKCHYTEFDNTGVYGSGFDLPPKKCPECGDVDMVRDGQDIPFETFLGFFGDKQPDIDLNFSGEYQPKAHKYVEYLFGKTHTFRAGTIGTYADKNAIGVARKVGELKGVSYTRAMLTYMSEGIEGVKRTTSQHPGGIVVVPKEMDVYEFTPIQYPANKTDCGIITTHFDFRAMHDTILKLDILGHADPTVLRMLQTLTNIEVTTIPIPEPKVMSLLESTDALGFDISKTDAGAATLGLSELGTNMARSMIKETHPTRFYDLVQLMGLSHGTDVWKGNAQDLINDGICDLNSVIGCRDSIMTSLIYWGVPNKDAFDIMEGVRKGKVAAGKVEKWPQYVEEMKEHNVPDWYIESCQKIKYMFPKAHAAAYSISTLRVAWFKVYYPEEYYCAFFTIRGDEFNAENMCQGLPKLTAHRKALGDQMKMDDNPKVKSEFYLSEIVEEMYARGIEFLPIDLQTSAATKFTKVEKGKILPPLSAYYQIPDTLAEKIVAEREKAPFANREELMQRCGIGSTTLDKIKDYGLLDYLPESSQINMFELLGGSM